MGCLFAEKGARVLADGVGAGAGAPLHLKEIEHFMLPQHFLNALHPPPTLFWHPDLTPILTPSFSREGITSRKFLLRVACATASPATRRDVIMVRYFMASDL